jgi:DNA-binding NarL/FixJ family response regulator
VHAEVRVDRDVRFVDLGSRHGSFLWGVRLETNVPIRLAAGDAIRIGKMLVVLQRDVSASDVDDRIVEALFEDLDHARDNAARSGVSARAAVTARATQSFILLVGEDDFSMECAIIRVLAPVCAVVTARRPEDALAATGHGECAGIIVKEDFLGGSGVAWLGSMRERAMVRIPALVLGTRCVAATVNAVQRLNARFLCKPFGREELRPFIAEVSARHDDRAKSLIQVALTGLRRTHGLTANETAILAGACNGLSREEFCDARRISVNTYKDAARRMLRKLRASSVGEVRDRVLREIAPAGPLPSLGAADEATVKMPPRRSEEPRFTADPAS